MNREFVCKHFPDFLEKYDTYPCNIQRADAIRYLLLKEYIERLRRYPYGENCLKLQVDEKTVEISYLKMEGEAKEIMLPKQKFCQISGNNVDGVILTLWEKRDGKA